MNTIVEKLSALFTADKLIAVNQNTPVEYQFLADRINNAERKVVAIVTPITLDELQKLLVFSADQAFSLFNLLSPGEINTAPIPANGDIVVIDLKKLNAII